MTSKSKRQEIESARKEITQLFALAKIRAASEQSLAVQYIAKARKLASRNRISLRAYNRMHCRKCSAYWTSKTLRVRTRPTTIVYTCLSCGNVKRIPKK